MKKNKIRIAFAVFFLTTALLILCSFKETDDFFRYEERDDGNIRIVAFVGEKFSTKADIPAYIDGKKVVEICESAFYSNEFVKQVTIPATVETIGISAFAYCGSLREVIIEKGGSPLTLPQFCFENCTDLKKISFGDREIYIDEYAFKNCTTLGKVYFPSTVREIGYNAFMNCEQLIMNSDDCEVAREYAEKNNIPTSFLMSDNYTFIIILVLTVALLAVIYTVYKLITRKKTKKYDDAKGKGKQSYE